MSSRGLAVSEVRANFLDLASYAIPGGVLLLVALSSLQYHVNWNAVAFLAEELFAPLGENWPAAMTVVVLGCASYPLGLVLRVLDDAFWASLATRSMTPGEFAVDKVSRDAEKLWGWSESGTEAPRALLDLLGTFVQLKAPAADAWVERYSALENLTGGMAWAIALGGATFSALSFGNQTWDCSASLLASIAIMAFSVVFFVFVKKCGQADYSHMRLRLIFYTAYHLLHPQGKPGEKAQ